MTFTIALTLYLLLGTLPAGAYIKGGVSEMERSQHPVLVLLIGVPVFATSAFLVWLMWLPYGLIEIRRGDRT